MKGADMITPIGTLNINQIAERKDDLLVSSDDIKELARNERNKVIDEFISELHKIGEHREFDWEDIYKLADQLKGGAE